MTNVVKNVYQMGRGEVLFARFLPGTQKHNGYRPLGNCPAFTVNITEEKQDHFSSMTGTREKDFSVTTSVNRSGTLNTDNISDENFAMALLGDVSVRAQAAATAVLENFRDTVKGNVYQLGEDDETNPTGIRNISSVVVRPITSWSGSTPTVGSTPYEAVEDYLVDPVNGTVQILPDGDIPADQDIQISYSQAESTRTQVISGDNSIEGALKYIEHNPQDGTTSQVLMPYVKLSPNGEVSFITETEFRVIPMTVEVLKKTGMAPIFRDGVPVLAVP